MSDPVADLAATVVDDPLVRAHTQQLVLAALDEAKQMLRRGRPDQKIALMRVLLPVLTRSLQQHGEEDDETKEARKKLVDLFETVKGA